MKLRQGFLVIAAVVGFMAQCAFVQAEAAEPISQGPTISLDRPSVKPGERLIVSLAGWKSQVVTVAVCGNLAKRGSGDCNMSAGTALGINRGVGTAIAQIVVASPPTNCPCVIRAASNSQDEVLLAPIELIGVPIDPLVNASSTSPTAISLDIRQIRGGIAQTLRGMLGGARDYDVKVLVSNRTNEVLKDVEIWGSVGHNRSDELVSIKLPHATGLQPGSTWAHTTRVRLPAPVFGSYVWRVGATGTSASDQAELTTKLIPYGLILLITFLIVDLVAIVWRRRARMRRQEALPLVSDDDTTDLVISLDDQSVPAVLADVTTTIDLIPQAEHEPPVRT